MVEYIVEFIVIGELYLIKRPFIFQNLTFASISFMFDFGDILMFLSKVLKFLRKHKISMNIILEFLNTL